MSLETLLTSLGNARGALVESLGSKGVTLASSATLYDCASGILDIPTGSGGVDPSSTTATPDKVLSPYRFVGSNGVYSSGTIQTVSATSSGGSVTVPVGYIASEQVIPAGGSGGTDVSDTTATAAAVLSGYDFYDSSGVKTSGTIPTVAPVSSGSTVEIASGYLASPVSIVVSGGVDVSDTTATPSDVLSGALFHDSTGALVSGGILTYPESTYTPTTSAQYIPAGVYMGGSQTIPGDANLVGSNILSGVTIFGVSGTLTPGGSSGGADVTLGYITSDGKFQALTFSGTSAANSGEPVALSAYTWNLPEPASASAGVVIYSGGSIVSSAASIMSGKNITSGLTQTIYSGGTATLTTVYDGGRQVVSAGGSAESATIGGSQIVAGTATSDVLNLSGFIEVLPGGKVLQLSVEQRASIYVSSGGTAYGNEVESGLAQITSETGALVSIIPPA